MVDSSQPHSGAASKNLSSSSAPFSPVQFLRRAYAHVACRTMNPRQFWSDPWEYDSRYPLTERELQDVRGVLQYAIRKVAE